MSTDDKSGKPGISTIISAPVAEPKMKPKAKHPGARPLWNLEEEITKGQTKFKVRYGESKTRFTIEGNEEDAAYVVSALRMREKVERNAMRAVLSKIPKESIDGDPTLSAWNEEEDAKLRMFYDWLIVMGNVLLTTGKRPWSGKYGTVNEGEALSVPLVVVNHANGGGDAGSGGN